MRPLRFWQDIRKSRQPAPSPAGEQTCAPSPEMLTRAEMFTLIGPDLVLGSAIGTAGPAVIAGCVSGNVEAPWVEVDAGARIRGSVKADDAVINGEVLGNVYGNNIALGASARIAGEVVCERLHAADGAVVGGRTHPSRRLNRALLRDLARIARSARAAAKIDQEVLRTLSRDGLVFERGDAVFVSIYGHLELHRRWARATGVTTERTCRLHLLAKRPPQVAAYRREARTLNAPLSVIADDLRVEGDLETRGDIRIHGDVRGDVAARDCAIGDASRIAGDVTARRACIAGHVSGAVTAETVQLLTTARVGGEVTFGTIEARGGAIYASGRQMGRQRAAPLRALPVAEAA